MAKARSKLPSYRHHKASGQACVKLSGRTIYLGPHGTRLSRDNYDRVVSEWLAAGRTFPQDNGSHVVTIAEVLLAFNNSNAIPPSQRHSYKSVMKIIARLYGTTAVEDFGPRALLAVQEQMIRAGWNRQTCNTRLYLARRIFKWGVSRQLVPAGVYEALKTVDGLEARLEAAPEPKAVQAVAVEHVEACLPFMSPTVAAMVKLQMHTGMRPGEVVQLRTCDVDASGDVWIYNPAKHKTQHLGKARPIAIGPKGIEILRPWLRSDLNAYVFSPADAERERRERLSAMRKTPLNQGNRVGSKRSKRPHTAPSEKYTVATYR
ncbi:MAG: tyrosine-type recombinase/integrase, partial [Tepidisphaeraceae bacterium]